jgi:hypothetical protein
LIVSYFKKTDNIGMETNSVSPRTHLRSAFIGVLGLFLGFTTAQADLDSALTARSKAMNEYYDRLKQSGKPSSEVGAKLYQEVVGPADRGLQQSLQSEMGKTVKDTLDRVKKEPLKLGSKKQKGVVASPAPDAMAKKSVPVPEPDRPKREEVVLDGKDIPREMEFQPAAPAPKPSAKPATAPSGRL